jgi:hypothetical protein
MQIDDDTRTGPETEEEAEIRAWDAFWDMVGQSTQDERMSDMDAWAVWRLGLAAWKEARAIGAKFPHE